MNLAMGSPQGEADVFYAIAISGVSRPSSRQPGPNVWKLGLRRSRQSRLRLTGSSGVASVCCR